MKKFKDMVKTIGSGWNAMLEIRIVYTTKNDEVEYASTFSMLHREISTVQLADEDIVITFNNGRENWKLRNKDLSELIEAYDTIMKYHSAWIDVNENLGNDKPEIPAEALKELMHPMVQLTKKNAETAVQMGEHMGEVVDVLVNLRKLMELGSHD